MTRLRRFFLVPAVLAILLGCHVGGHAATEPCGFYFTSGRAGAHPGPVAWLAGVWIGTAEDRPGERRYLEVMWTPLIGGTMQGVARTSAITQHAPTATLSVDFIAIRQDAAGKVVYEEQAGAAAPIAFQLVEGRDGFAAFERTDGGVVTRVTLRLVPDGGGRLDLERTRGQERMTWLVWRKV